MGAQPAAKVDPAGWAAIVFQEFLHVRIATPHTQNPWFLWFRVWAGRSPMESVKMFVFLVRLPSQIFA
jgi:hypothetical protein